MPHNTAPFPVLMGQGGRSKIRLYFRITAHGSLGGQPHKSVPYHLVEQAASNAQLAMAGSFMFPVPGLLL